MINFKDLDFVHPGVTGEALSSYLIGRDALRLLLRPVGVALAYKPSGEEIDWLQKQLRAYCEHYFPGLGILSRVSGAGKMFYRLLRTCNRFGAVYLVVVGNIPPQGCMSILCGDLDHQHLDCFHPELAAEIAAAQDADDDVAGALADRAIEALQSDSEYEHLVGCLRVALCSVAAQAKQRK